MVVVVSGSLSRLVTKNGRPVWKVVMAHPVDHVGALRTLRNSPSPNVCFRDSMVDSEVGWELT